MFVEDQIPVFDISEEAVVVASDNIFTLAKHDVAEEMHVLIESDPLIQRTLVCSHKTDIEMIYFVGKESIC